MKNPIFTSVALLSLVCTACERVTEQQSSVTTQQTPTTVQANPTTATNSPLVQTDTAPLPAPQTLNLQVNHANGSVLRLTQVSFGEDNITTNLAATNGYKDAIKLNKSDDMVLKDSLGNQYNLAAPPDNPEITIQPGTTLKGQFVFKGRIAPSANSITLTTNSKFGTSAEFSITPELVIANIPVQGQ